MASPEKVRAAKLARARMFQKLFQSQGLSQDQGRGFAGAPSSTPDPLLPDVTDITGAELGDVGAGSNLGALRIAGGLITTPDDKAVANIIAKVVPGVQIGENDRGEITVRFPQKPGESVLTAQETEQGISGKQFVINKAGLDKADIPRFVGQLVAFVRGGKFLGVGKGKHIVTRVLKTATGEALVSGALDLAAIGQGSEQGVSVGRAALAATFGAGFQALGEPAKRFIGRVINQPRLFNFLKGTLTKRGEAEAKAAGIDVAGVNTVFARAFSRELAESGGVSVSGDVVGGLAETILPGRASAAVAASREAAKQPGREAAATISLSRQFDIPPLRGEVSGDPKELALAQDVRLGKAGGKAGAGDMDVFDQRRLATEERARKRIQATATGGEAPRYPTEAPAAAAAVTSLEAAETAARRSVTDAYEAAGVNNPAFTGKDARTLIAGVKDYLFRNGFDPKLHKKTNIARMALIALDKRLAKLSGASTPKIQTGFVGSGTPPVQTAKQQKALFSEFENVRRIVGEAVGQARKAGDRRHATALKGEFDKFMDDAVDNALFSGDTAFLELFKSARRANTDFMKRFTQQGTKDGAGRTVEKLLAEGPLDPEKAMRLVFGLSGLGNNQAATQVVRRLKQALGDEQADGFKALGEIGVMRLTQPKGPGSSMVEQAKAIDGFFRTSPSLAKELFTPETAALLKNFAFLGRRGEINPATLRQMSLDEGITFTKLVRAFIRRGGTMATFRGHPGAGAVLFMLARVPGTRSRVVRRLQQIPRPRQPAPLLTGAAAALGRDVDSPANIAVRDTASQIKERAKRFGKPILRGLAGQIGVDF
jgi:hypothetical protein